MTNIQGVQKAGLKKKKFPISSKTMHNDDSCFLFNLNLMGAGVVKTHCFQSLNVTEIIPMWSLMATPVNQAGLDVNSGYET